MVNKKENTFVEKKHMWFACSCLCIITAAEMEEKEKDDLASRLSLSCVRRLGEDVTDNCILCRPDDQVAQYRKFVYKHLNSVVQNIKKCKIFASISSWIECLGMLGRARVARPPVGLAVLLTQPAGWQRRESYILNECMSVGHGALIYFN